MINPEDICELCKHPFYQHIITTRGMLCLDCTPSDSMGFAYHEFKNKVGDAMQDPDDIRVRKVQSGHESPSGRVGTKSFEEWREEDGRYNAPEIMRNPYNVWFRMRDLKVTYEAGQQNPPPPSVEQNEDDSTYLNWCVKFNLDKTSSRGTWEVARAFGASCLAHRDKKG